MVVQPFVTSPVQPFVTSPVQPFLNPGFGFPPTQAPFVAVHPRGFNHRRVIVPGSVIVQPQGHFFAAGPVPTVPQHRPPEIGTPRGHVINQLGVPSTTIITRDGETLFFNGGITVFIQNGTVARPR
jgi:hypothetical protein